MLKAILLASAVLAVSSAHSAVLRYDYTGNELVLIGTHDLDDTIDRPEIPPTIPSFKAVIVIDEQHLPGGSVAGQTLSYYGTGLPDGGPDEYSAYPDYLLYIELYFGLYFSPLNFPGYELGGAYYFQFDANKNLAAWSIWTFDYDDYVIDHAYGDTYVEDYYNFGGYGGGIYASDPGSWSGPTAIPVPAPLALLAASLAGVWMMGKKRV
jgi:hypothetical protein